MNLITHPRSPPYGTICGVFLSQRCIHIVLQSSETTANDLHHQALPGKDPGVFFTCKEVNNFEQCF